MVNMLPQDRLVRKEVALGVIREIPPPMQHIGLASIAPFKEVQSDDAVFQYAIPTVDGLAPARAEDAESELAMKDDSIGLGRASVIDWALKDHYDPSDVDRYREYLRMAELAGGGLNGLFPLTVGNVLEDFPSKLDRDQALRKRKLDNRIEKMIMDGLETSHITYNDGKIVFDVDFGRPANQQDQAPLVGDTWNLDTGDPIGALIAADQFMYDTYYAHLGHAIISRKVALSMLNSTRFKGLSGMVGATGSAPVDPRYLVPDWGVPKMLDIVTNATGITFEVYDAVYRTRALGSKTTVNHRFTSDKKVILLPTAADIAELDQTEIGFAKTLTSPHPEGNWTPSYYEWEKDTGPDPWGMDRGTGIKAFPVFPHLEYSYVMTVLP